MNYFKIVFQVFRQKYFDMINLGMNILQSSSKWAHVSYIGETVDDIAPSVFIQQLCEFYWNPFSSINLL